MIPETDSSVVFSYRHNKTYNRPERWLLSWTPKMRKIRKSKQEVRDRLNVSTRRPSVADIRWPSVTTYHPTTTVSWKVRTIVDRVFVSWNEDGWHWSLGSRQGLGPTGRQSHSGIQWSCTVGLILKFNVRKHKRPTERIFRLWSGGAERGEEVVRLHNTNGRNPYSTFCRKRVIF